MQNKIGAALVVGAGISGIRSALDLAEMGYRVTLIDKAPRLGGTLAQLDYQFPSDHCGMCKMLPVVERDASSQYCLRKGLFHENIDILLSTELEAMEGEPGKYRVTLRQQATDVNADRCIGCGECARVCPVEVADDFNAGLTLRKAIYLPVPHNIPNHYVVDRAACTRCGECVRACPTQAIDFHGEKRRSFRILVVDDELIVRDSLKEWLQDEGFHVDMAGSGEEALSKLAGQTYQLMLLDIKMPGMDGVEVLKRAKEIRPDLQVVMMTAYATVETAVEAMKLGARDYLLKPFDPEALVVMVAQIFQSIERIGERVIEVGAVILSAGFASYDPGSGDDAYGYRVLPNVVTSLEFERLVSGSGPNQGRLLRPGDGREMRRIAWLQCVGSRNLQLDADYCSSVCCMFAIKEALLAKERSNGQVDTAIFYMDMRTFGMDFQRYRDRAENEHGVRFQRSRVHTVEPSGANGELRIVYTDTAGAMQEELFDLVVLANGQRPAAGTEALAEKTGVELNPWGFCQVKAFSQSRTAQEGVLVSGSYSGLRDISESVIQASAAALAASTLIHSKGGGLAEITGGQAPPAMEPRDVSREPVSVAVVLCTCDGALQTAADPQGLAADLRALGGVHQVHIQERVCTQDGWQQLQETLRTSGANRLLIGACLPYVYGRKLRELAKVMGLDAALMEVADIRTPSFPGRTADRQQRSREVGSTLGMALARLRGLDPEPVSRVPVVQKALVVGGGIAGMTAALAMADHGFPVDLVEQAAELGGNLRLLHRTLQGEAPQELLQKTLGRLEKHPRIKVYKKARVIHSIGRVGRFFTTIEKEDGLGETLHHGVTVLATGAREATTTAYGYGQHPAIVTQHELEVRLQEATVKPAELGVVAMIQCVDSREEPRNYCSRVCCAAALKNALYLKEQNPDLDVYILYRDMMAYGFMESYYTRAREAGVVFIQYRVDAKPRVSITNGRPLVIAFDPILGRELAIPTDLLVLSTGMVASGQGDLARIFGVEVNQDGFFQEAESKWRPVDFLKEGIFMCGIAHSPRSVTEAVATAEAAAQRALRLLSSGAVSAGHTVAEVRHSLCALCEQCISACPYGARWRDEEEEQIVVDELMCQGCGTCATVCPNSAAVVRGHRDQQMFEVIDAALDIA
jgi:heterodisulfide reductase subunit A